jgi:molybdate transport system permease protein
MDWQALYLSFKLGLLTVICLIPTGILISFWMQKQSAVVNRFLEILFTLPLILPPTVLGYYLLVGFGKGSWLGSFLQENLHVSFVFSFAGILLASIIFNIPFAWLPIRRAFEAIPQDLKDAYKTCGLNPWRAFWKIELPLAAKGIMTALIMTFTHTLGEFGVVLMVGGNIPGSTRTVSIAIYDQLQTLQLDQAGNMALLLLIISFLGLMLSQSIFATDRHTKSVKEK